ncbi:Ribosomal protein S12 methylthiotransferase RimO [Pelotomaculum sp. FP]|uniref:30S ribosomal protein S12 methylthiotransferase RimO n=1 Tax=Pelotomaculum sp. FP TaxID=261474 RepID=UPI001066A5EC|nr:30S ribosomal protein S12 methylthiotransferase RimO [Pelotomaculum sp. FP]TEB16621.1 Ribosomal protein S12 methylthiotransferase RimO [Pelotomaculum sp. FP]
MTIKVGLVSLGCPKNLVDSEIMLGLLKESGFIITNREKEADVIIVNTCSFINDAKEESIKTIFELARLKEEGNCRVLLVAGCLAQRYHRELTEEMPEVDGLIGTGAIHEVPVLVRRALAGEKAFLVESPGYLHTSLQPRMQATPSYTSYLKIAEGCDNRCSYCTIPLVRGPFRSREAEDIINEAAGMVKQGTKELVLVAQDTTRYGLDLYGRPYLDSLLECLAGLEGLIWIRLLYTYPSLINDQLIRLIAREKKICNYLDIPLQHASNSVLQRMKRQGGNAEIQRLIKKLRAEIPGIILRSTFIVGFPGETEEDFEELLSFMTSMQFDRVGVFTYSREEDTPAASMPDQVPEEIKMARRDKAMSLQQKISHEKNRGKIGAQLSVLVEKKNTGKTYTGRSEGDAPGIDGKVKFTSETHLQPGDFVKVLITAAQPYDLTGKLVRE